MNVTQADSLADGTCPYCNTLLEVFRTNEDSLYDCEGEFSCPVCHERVLLGATLFFDFTKVTEV